MISSSTLEGYTQKEADNTVGARSSSRARSTPIATASTVSVSAAAAVANSATQAFPRSESGPETAKPSSRRNSLTAARSAHAARLTTVPGPSKPQSSRRPTSYPSSSPSPSPSPPRSLSSSQSFSTSHPPSTSTASYSTSQVNASPAHGRTAPARRPPASRSSHGIETSSGPPPALITQRSYTAEATRRHPSPADLTVNRPAIRGRSQTDGRIDSKAHRRHISADDRGRAGPLPSSDIKRMEPDKRKHQVDSSPASYQSRDDETDRTLRGLRSNHPSPALRGRAEPETHENEPFPLFHEEEDAQPLEEERHPQPLREQEPSKSLQEDLFLNLARSDSLVDHPTDALTRSQRRRSRISMSSSRQPYTPQPLAPQSSSSRGHFQGHPTPSSHDPPHSQWSPPGQFEEPNLQFYISPRDRQHVTTSHPLDSRDNNRYSVFGTPGSFKSSRIRSGSNQESPHGMPAASGGRQSVREPSPGLTSRAYKQSNLSYSTNSANKALPTARGQESTLGSRKRLQIHQAEDTASTVSTAAPSTIWDHVEGLKHRIQHLEHTRQPPVSSGAPTSNVLGERPRTASTTTTTISTSPKHAKAFGLPHESLRIQGRETFRIHPLLHTALAQSKSVIAPKRYQALETAALDALALAAMAGSVVGLESPPVSADNPPVDRQLRRKADSLCRSLTELCIALCAEDSDGAGAPAERHVANKGRATSVYQSVEDVPGPSYVRASTEEPEFGFSARLRSRLEARRASMGVFNHSRGRQESPLQVVNHGAAPETNRMAFSNRSRQESPLQVQFPAPDGDRVGRSSVLGGGGDRNMEQPIDHHQYYHQHHHNQVRPVSRAATDIGTQFLPPPSPHVPYEYMPQHLPPYHRQRSPSVGSSFLRGSSHFPSPPAQSQTMSPSTLVGSQQYLDSMGPLTPAESAHLAEFRQWRMASLGTLGHHFRGYDGGLHQHEGNE